MKTNIKLIGALFLGVLLGYIAGFFVGIDEPGQTVILNSSSSITNSSNPSLSEYIDGITNEFFKANLYVVQGAHLEGVDALLAGYLTEFAQLRLQLLDRELGKNKTNNIDHLYPKDWKWPTEPWFQEYLNNLSDEDWNKLKKSLEDELDRLEKEIESEKEEQEYRNNPNPSHWYSDKYRQVSSRLTNSVFLLSLALRER